MARQATKTPAGRQPGTEPDDAMLLEMYWQMVRSRKLDERAWVLHRQGKIAFHISAMGHEACQTGAAFAMRRGYDYLHPYYRDLTIMLCLGLTPREFMLGVFGRQGEPSSGARQMPSHFGLRRANVITSSSPTGTQIPQAAGVALGEKLKQTLGLSDGDLRVTLVCFGEGTTAQGDFHEGLNWAGIHKLPVVFLCQNNQYAISVPLQLQMAVPNVADRAAAYGMPGVIVDGNDVIASYVALKQAFDRARAGDGPTLVEAKTYRPVPHSSDDDDRTYRSREEVEAWKKKDPLLRAREALTARGLLDEAGDKELQERATAEVEDAHEFAEAQPFPDPEDALWPVYAEDVRP
jgi:2-oxoisovalerate dehydrogenase E1 component alpha subunit